MLNFELIGLSGRDKRVYETLLASQNSSIRSISESTGINRGSVYESLKDLTLSGLVSYVEVGERRKYTAQDPELIHEIINEKRRDLNLQHSRVDEYIEQLAPVSASSMLQLRFATFYEGDEGLANILRDVLATCRSRGVSSYCAISSPRVGEYLYHNFRHFTLERIKQQLRVDVIGFGVSQLSQDDLFERRALKGDSYDTSCYTIIYDTKVAFISIDSLNIASGVVVDNKEIADIQRLLFYGLWQQLGE